MRTSALFGAKNFGFFEIYWLVRTDKGGVEPVQTYCRQGGGGQFFAILCGRLLWTIMLCICLTIPTQNGSVHSFSWTTAISRLFGSKMRNGK